MCMHQQKHALTQRCLFYVLFLTNQITDVLSDLSSELNPGASAEPWAQNVF